MAFEIADPEPYLRYQLRVTVRQTGEEVYRTDELVKKGSWLSLVLPSGYLADDTVYELRFGGTMGAEVTELKETYLIVLRR